MKQAVPSAALRPSPGFLFLQGPHGFYFPRLGRLLAERGARVLRVNLNGGDWATWPEGHNYRGTAGGWPRYLRGLLEREGIRNLVLYGDCRPCHAAAIAVAREAGVQVHVFEEGYLRPDWITLERDGVNGHSTLPDDPEWYREQARALPPTLPELTTALAPYAETRRWGAFFYYAQATLQRWRFPFVVDHRAASPIREGLSYLAKFCRAGGERRLSARALEMLGSRRFMLFPLQLDADAQIRTHSSFSGMRDAARHVVESFARAAPADLALVIKEHPLDSGLIRWRPFFAELAAERRLGDRLVFVEHGDLDDIVARSEGVVTVNSTTGTMVLAAGKPVAVLGRAVYDIPGLTDRQPLDRFWSAPVAPDPELFHAFARVLADRCLVRGAFLAHESDDALIGAADRLMRYAA